jgi:hypothetical protein
VVDFLLFVFKLLIYIKEVDKMSEEYIYNIGDFVVVFPHSKSNRRVGFIYEEITQGERYLLYIDGNIEEWSVYFFVLYNELMDMYEQKILKKENI